MKSKYDTLKGALGEIENISDLEAQLVKAKELLFHANEFIPFYQFELKQEIELFISTNKKWRLPISTF